MVMPKPCFTEKNTHRPTLLNKKKHPLAHLARLEALVPLALLQQCKPCALGGRHALPRQRAPQLGQLRLPPRRPRLFPRLVLRRRRRRLGRCRCRLLVERPFLTLGTEKM